MFPFIRGYVVICGDSFFTGGDTEVDGVGMFVGAVTTLLAVLVGSGDGLLGFVFAGAVVGRDGLFCCCCNCCLHFALRFLNQT